MNLSNIIHTFVIKISSKNFLVTQIHINHEKTAAFLLLLFLVLGFTNSYMDGFEEKECYYDSFVRNTSMNIGQNTQKRRQQTKICC